MFLLRVGLNICCHKGGTFTIESHMNRYCADNETLGPSVQVDTCYDLTTLQSVSDVFKQRTTFHQALYQDYGANYFAQAVFCSGNGCNSRTYQSFCGYKKKIKAGGRLLAKAAGNTQPSSQDPTPAPSKKGSASLTLKLSHLCTIFVLFSTLLLKI